MTPAAVKQLTLSERRLIDKMVRAQKASPTDALHKINAKRLKANIRLVEKSCVHRYVKGLTHKPDTQDSGLQRAEIFHSLGTRPVGFLKTAPWGDSTSGTSPSQSQATKNQRRQNL